MQGCELLRATLPAGSYCRLVCGSPESLLDLDRRMRMRLTRQMEPAGVREEKEQTQIHPSVRPAGRAKVQPLISATRGRCRRDYLVANDVDDAAPVTCRRPPSGGAPRFCICLHLSSASSVYLIELYIIPPVHPAADADIIFIYYSLFTLLVFCFVVCVRVCVCV